MTRWTIPLAALLLAACGPLLPDRLPGPSRPFDAGARQIVFQVSGGPGGLSPANYGLGFRPGVTIYGNGDAYVVTGRTDYRSYPGRPIAFAKGSVPRRVLRDLAADADRSGLFAGADYGQAMISDAGGTSVAFRPGRAAAQTVSVYALDIEDADDSLSAVQQQNRRDLRAFEDRLSDSVVIESSTPWTPDRIDVSEAYGQEDAADTALPWTGPSIDQLLQPRKNRGGRCGVMSGTDARRVYATARAHGTTHWRDGSTDRYLVVRALLPGETGCR